MGSISTKYMLLSLTNYIHEALTTGQDVEDAGKSKVRGTGCTRETHRQRAAVKTRAWKREMLAMHREASQGLYGGAD